MVRVNPSKSEVAHLPAATEVTFAPMEAIVDGLGGLDLTRTKAIEEVDGGSYSFFAEGDLLLAKVTPCFENGKKALAHGLKNGIGFATSEVHVIRPNSSKIDPAFLMYVLSSEDFRAAAMASMTGAGGLRRVAETAILDYRLLITDVQIQHDIADFLDRETARVDQLIEKKRRMVTLIGEQRGAAISVAVTRGFESHEPLQRTSSPYLPFVPVGWSIKRLKQLAVVRGGITLGRVLSPAVPTVETPYLRVANVQAGRLDLGTVATLDATEAEIRHYSLRAGDVLMNEGGDNDKLGRGAVWDGSIDSCLHQNHVFAVRPHDPDLAQWISLASNSRYGRDFFYLNSKQSTNLASIAKSKLEQFPIAVPQPCERFRIMGLLEERLHRCDSLTVSIGKTIERLHELRAALITAAVTGQIDVATWGKRGETDRRLEAIEHDLGAERKEAAR
jgi:type I restriction enzyme S subunit